MRQNNMQPGQAMVSVPCAKLAVWGLKADLHVRRHKEKLDKYHFDCGLDLFPTSAPLDRRSLSSKMMRINVSTGLYAVIPPGAFGMITDRSSTPERLFGATTYGGIIDAGYTGEIMVHVHCDVELVDLVCAAIQQCAQDEIAIAQMIIIGYFIPIMEISQGKPVIAGRGDRGYGSTDKKVV